MKKLFVPFNHFFKNTKQLVASSRDLAQSVKALNQALAKTQPMVQEIQGSVDEFSRQNEIHFERIARLQEHLQSELDALSDKI